MCKTVLVTFLGLDYPKDPLDFPPGRTNDSNILIWLQVDPLWEKYPGWSPYNYVLNNPLRFVDPDGRYTKAIIDGHYFFHRYSPAEAKLIIYGQIGLLESLGTNDPSFRPQANIGDKLTQTLIERLAGFEGKLWSGVMAFFGTAEANFIWNNSKANFERDKFAFEYALGIQKDGIPALLKETVKELKNGYVISLTESNGRTLRLNPEYVEKFYQGDYEKAFNDIDESMQMEKSLRFITNGRCGTVDYRNFIQNK